MVRNVVVRRQRSRWPGEDVSRRRSGRGRGERLLLKQVLQGGRIDGRVPVTATVVVVVLLIVAVVVRRWRQTHGRRVPAVRTIAGDRWR